LPIAKSPYLKEIRGGMKCVDFRMRKNKKIELAMYRFPYNPKSPAQQDIRSRYGKAVEGWRALTDEEKQSYNEKAKQEQISGWNYYLREQMLAPPIVYEDFTTFTEVDPNNRITVQPNLIISQVTRSETAYVYADYGVDYFKNFTHELEVLANDPTTKGVHSEWVLANAVGNLNELRGAGENYITVQMYDMEPTGTRYIILREYYEGTVYQQYVTGLSVNTKYYLRIKKEGTSLTLEVYSDAERTNLLYTLSITLHIDYAFRYLYASSSWNDARTEQVYREVANIKLA